jgi:EAL domain-containing protein (putative c-di-GMP-specific phosphodiesterase class I)
MLAYQPIVDALTPAVDHYECLLRLRRRDGQVVTAGAFVPLVEQSGLMRQVDRRALELAIEELSAHPRVRLAVNISGHTASDRGWLRMLSALVRGMPEVAERLTVEITETVALQDIDDTARFVRKLRDLGCRVALDDFGAGYTSFRNLKALDVDCVKIDGSFVKGLSENVDNQLFVRTLLGLAEGLGLKTVAECVETAADAALLARRGVRYLQGWYFGKPTLERPWLAEEAAAPSQQLATAGAPPKLKVLTGGIAGAGRRRPGSLAREFLEPALHQGHLAPEFVDGDLLVGRGRLRRAGGVVGARRIERPPHLAHRLLEDLHVLLAQLLELAAEREEAAEGGLHRLADLFLVARERLHRRLEIAWHHGLEIVAVEADELAQEADRQQVLPALRLLLDDDLGEDRTRDVVAGLRVVDDELDPLLDHLREVVERHVAGGGGVVEPPVRVFLDLDDLLLVGRTGRARRLVRLFRCRHAGIVPAMAAACKPRRHGGKLQPHWSVR